MKIKRLTVKQLSWLFYAYAAFLFLISLSVSMMPVASLIKPSLLPLNGTLFWLGFMGTAVTSVIFTVQCKRAIKNTKKQPKNKKIGLIRFLRFREAAVADLAMLCSFIGTIAGVIVVAVAPSKPYTMFIFAGIFIFAFGMHCMLNGNNYAFIRKNIFGEIKKDQGD